MWISSKRYLDSAAQSTGASALTVILCLLSFMNSVYATLTRNRCGTHVASFSLSWYFSSPSCTHQQGNKMTEPWIENKQRILLVVLSEVVTSVFTLSSSSAEHPMIFSAGSLKTESQASPEGSETFTTIIYLYRHNWTLGSVRANACLLLFLLGCILLP